MTFSQTKILLSLIQGEEARLWASDRDGWNASVENVCSWEGIQCEGANDDVTGISLPRSDLSATIPTEIALLTNIQTINMEHNLIRGTLPSEFMEMQSLVTVKLSENLLIGTVSAFESPVLEELDLGFNRLEGSLPAYFNAMNSKLKLLELRHNAFTGSIPSSIENLKELTFLSLSGNKMTGTLPLLKNSQSLERLYVDENELVGTVPSAWGVDSKLMFPELVELWMSDNSLSGSIPSGLANLESLETAFLNENKLTGTIPQQLCTDQMNDSFWESRGTDENGDTDTQGVNLCDAIACPVDHTSGNGEYPCFQCPSALPNQYIGREKQCQGFTEAKIVAKLLKTEKPESACDLDGIYCDSNGNVVKIHANGRRLKGTIPDELGFLPFLEELDLSDNELTGQLPSGLRFAPLKKLDVSGNKLRGIVPPLLCNKDGLNGNGKGHSALTCHAIACPVGTFSHYGHGICQPCDNGEGMYLASKNCSPAIGSTSREVELEHTRSAGKVVAVIFVALIILSTIAAVLIRRKRKVALKFDGDHEEESHDLPYIDEHPLEDVALV